MAQVDAWAARRRTGREQALDSRRGEVARSGDEGIDDVGFAHLLWPRARVEQHADGFRTHLVESGFVWLR